MTDQLWTKTERETEDAHICCDATCATPHSAMPLRRVAAGALLIEDLERAVLVGADAICSPRHRHSAKPCETCKARVRMVFAAVGEGDR